MAETTYSYTIATDFPNGKVDTDCLTLEIEQSSITTELARINTNPTICDVVFVDALSAGEKTTLDGDTSPPAAGSIIGDHQGIPILSIQEGEPGWDIKVEDDDLTSPPGSPDANDFYVVGEGATGAWEGKDGYFTRWDGVAWEFVHPRSGDACFVADGQYVIVYKTEWKRLEEYQNVVRSPSSSTTNAIARYADTTGKLAKNSGVTVNDADQIEGCVTASFYSEYNNGPLSGTESLDWNNGQKQVATLTGNVTLTFTAPPGTSNLLFRIVQDATGGRTITWPSSVKWSGGTAPTLGAANEVDIVTFYYNGTNYYGVASLNFS